MRPLAVAVIRSGLVSEESVGELKRWGLPVAFVEVEEKDVVKTTKQIIDVIQDALESAEQVTLRDTDLDILGRWLDPANQRNGRLVMKNDDDKSTAKITYCLTPLGEYVIPWRAESIADLLLNGDSYLRLDGSNEKIFFRDVRELFIGDTKAFMVCAAEVK